jgi:hypothetical protein
MHLEAIKALSKDSFYSPLILPNSLMVMFSPLNSSFFNFDFGVWRLVQQLLREANKPPPVLIIRATSMRFRGGYNMTASKDSKVCQDI